MQKVLLQPPSILNSLHKNGTTPYYHRSFGKLISLFVLDTYQVTDLADQAQTCWLDSAMNANQHLKCHAVMAMYHVPLYPSYSEFDNALSSYLRVHWMPLFDNYRLDVAFENHDHALKCTYPMKEGKIDSTGTYYIGDGAWGRGPRDSVATDRSYIRYSNNILHYWVCKMNASEMKMDACGVNGEVLYSFLIKLDD